MRTYCDKSNNGKRHCVRPNKKLTLSMDKTKCSYNLARYVEKATWKHNVHTGDVNGRVDVFASNVAKKITVAEVWAR